MSDNLDTLIAELRHEIMMGDHSIALKRALDALELARNECNRFILEAESTDNAIEMQSDLDAQLAATLTGRP